MSPSAARQPFTPAEWATHDPDHPVLRVTTDAPGLLVVADTWMPGWSALVDGLPAPVLRGNHAQRVIPLVRARAAHDHARLPAARVCRWAVAITARFRPGLGICRAAWRSTIGFDDVDHSDVDSLSSTSLMAMNGEHDLRTWLELCLCGRRNLDGLIGS